MHLRRCRIRKRTVALPGGGGEERPSFPTPPPPRILCPAQRWRPWACSCPIAQGPREWGADGAEGVRSPCVIANSKEGGGAGGGGGGR